MQALRFNNWKRTYIAQSENLNEQNKTIQVGRKKQYHAGPEKAELGIEYVQLKKVFVLEQK